MSLGLCPLRLRREQADGKKGLGFMFRRIALGALLTQVTLLGCAGVDSQDSTAQGVESAAQGGAAALSVEANHQIVVCIPGGRRHMGMGMGPGMARPAIPPGPHMTPPLFCFAPRAGEEGLPPPGMRGPRGNGSTPLQHPECMAGRMGPGSPEKLQELLKTEGKPLSCQPLRSEQNTLPKPADSGPTSREQGPGSRPMPLVLDCDEKVGSLPEGLPQLCWPEPKPGDATPEPKPELGPKEPPKGPLALRCIAAPKRPAGPPTAPPTKG